MAAEVSVPPVFSMQGQLDWLTQLALYEQFGWKGELWSKAGSTWTGSQLSSSY